MAPRIRWYFERFRKMPAAEIPYRIGQTIRKRWDKMSSPFSEVGSVELEEEQWDRLGVGLSGSPLLEFLDRTQYVADGDRSLGHQFHVFGIDRYFGDPIDFHLDPQTGKRWPLVFWGDIDYRDGKTVGGIKFAWELNRLQHWPRLVLAGLLTGNDIYRRELFRQLDQWLAANPYPYGINWISGIELGIRLVNLVFALRFLGSPAITETERSTVVQFVSLHAGHLYRYPSRYSSCANHAVAEALGLFVAGLAFPWLKGAGKWVAFGRTVLDREAARQIYPDGSSFEHTTSYLPFVADHFLVYFLLCQEAGIPADGIVAHRLQAVCHFLSHMVDRSGCVPTIGDDDGGHLLKMWTEEHNNFLSLLNSGAVLFDRPDWIHSGAMLDAKTVLLLGQSSIEKWSRLKQSATSKCKGSRFFERAGLALIAYKTDDLDIRFVFNMGPLGLKPLFAHGHSDALSIWLSVNGWPFLVDPGTYLYHSGGKWRQHFRSTAAHNTVRIDGVDQAEQKGGFMFAEGYDIAETKWSQEEGDIICGGEHDGYSRLPDKVIHRREIHCSIKENAFEICDKLRCRGRHLVEVFFHLHPEVRLQQEGSSTFRLSRGSATVLLTAEEALASRVVRGSEDPIVGWFSPGFNELEPSNTLVLSTVIIGHSQFSTKVRIL